MKRDQALKNDVGRSELWEVPMEDPYEQGPEKDERVHQLH